MLLEDGELLEPGGPPLNVSHESRQFFLGAVPYFEGGRTVQPSRYADRICQVDVALCVGRFPGLFPPDNPFTLSESPLEHPRQVAGFPLLPGPVGNWGKGPGFTGAHDHEAVDDTAYETGLEAEPGVTEIAVGAGFRQLPPESLVEVRNLPLTGL